MSAVAAWGLTWTLRFMLREFTGGCRVACRYVASAVRAWLEFTQLNVQAEFPGSEEPRAENDARERFCSPGC